MAGARQNPNCPSGSIRGRPFTMADLNPRSLVSANGGDNTCSSTEVDSTCDYSSKMNCKPYKGQGRPFNPAIDITRNRACSPNQGAKLYTGEGRPFNPALDTSRNRVACCSNQQSSRNYTDLDSTCDYSTKSGKLYTGEGRPFNPALDITRNRSARYQNCQTGRQSEEFDSSRGCNSNVAYGPYVSKGRSFNPAFDITCNRVAQSSCTQQAGKQSSDRQRQLKLELEMARNKEKALERLRAEEAENCANQPRSPLDYTRQARDENLVCCNKPVPQRGGSRGRPLDLRIEKQRQQCKEPSNICIRPSRCYQNAGRPLDLYRPFSYNCATYTPPGAGGRPFDPDRDIPVRRSNLPTPKGQRANSCPTPVPNATTRSPIQRLPRISPRPEPSICPTLSSSSRSASPPAASGSNYTTTVTKTTIKSSAAPATKLPVQSPCRTLETPSSPATDEPEPIRGTVTKTVTTVTTTKSPPIQQIPDCPTSPPQASVCPMPQQTPIGAALSKSRDRSPCQPADTTTCTDYEQLNSDSAVFKMPSECLAPTASPFKPKQQTYMAAPSSQRTNASVRNAPPVANNRQTANESVRRSPTIQTNAMYSNQPSQPTTASPPPLDSVGVNSGNLGDLNRSRSCGLLSPATDRTFEWSNFSDVLANRTCENTGDSRNLTSAQQFDPPCCTSTQNELCYFQEPCQHNLNGPGRARDYGDVPCIDLSNCTQYQCLPMDMSSQEIPGLNSPAPNQGFSMHMHSYGIPQDDMTCYKRLPGNESQFQQSLPASPARAANNNEVMKTDCNTSQQPSNVASQICPPCDEQGAMAAQKPEDMPMASANMSPKQMCDTTTYGLNALFNTASPHGANCNCGNASKFQSNNTSAYGLNTLYNSACPQNMSYCGGNAGETQGHDTTGFGIRNLFGNTTDSMNLPNSIKECAQAKRCGRVQFDSTDKSPDPNRNARRKAEIEALVKDSYCPGIIQETIDGQENFNTYSLNLSLGKDATSATDCQRPPLDDPMTLLEAFSIRIENERTQIEKDIPDNAKQEDIENIIRNYFVNHMPTDLNRSIECLMLSEHLQEHEALEQFKGASLEADVQKLVTTLPDNANVKFIIYTGLTKPLQEAV